MLQPGGTLRRAFFEYCPPIFDRIKNNSANGNKKVFISPKKIKCLILPFGSLVNLSTSCKQKKVHRFTKVCKHVYKGRLTG